MSTPFLGEIRMFAGNFAIRGWSLCDGQSLPISQNDALFALIGTTYGGDGQTTFNLPDLRGRLPVHQGTLAGGGTYFLGQMSGTESVTLTSAQMPAHTHGVSANSGTGTSGSPTGNVVAATPLNPYLSGSPNVTLAANSIGSAGGNGSHENRMPALCVNFLISLEGIFPSRN